MSVPCAQLLFPCAILKVHGIGSFILATITVVYWTELTEVTRAVVSVGRIDISHIHCCTPDGTDIGHTHCCTLELILATCTVVH